MDNKSPASALLTFVAGGEHFALPVDAVRRVSLRPELVLLPGSPDFLEGFFEFQGALCAAVSLAALLSLADGTESDFYAPVLVLAGVSPCLALCVDRLHATVGRRDWRELPLPEARHFDGSARCLVEHGEGELSCLLDVDALLLREEKLRIAELEKLVRKRLERVA